MNRREFLKLCALAGVGSSSAIRAGIFNSLPSPADWYTLAKELSGELILPESRAYETARRLFNSRYDWIRPSALSMCRDPRDIRECLSFARRHAVGVILRSGGHSYAGWSTGTGLVIDVSLMNQVSVDLASGTATVGAGARLIDIYDQLAKYGVTIPAGSCATVGIAGMTLGGGVGMVGRAYGLTCDNLISVDMVGADGKIITADSHRNSDLYWACRGGGGGNFGVATSFTFRTHPARDITRLMLEWMWPDAANVIRAWQLWGPSAPDEIWSYCQLRTSLGDATPRVRVLVVFLGSQRDLEPFVSTLISKVGSEPKRNGETQSYLQAMLALAGCSARSVEECHLPSQAPHGILNRDAYSSKSDFFSNPLASFALDTAIHFIEKGNLIPGLLNGRITFDAFGGAIGRLHSGDTAFFHRNVLFNAQYLAYWQHDSAPETEYRCLAWLRSFHHGMRPYANGGAYVNYTDPELGEWQHAYYGSNYEQLLRVKAKYDPNWIFRLPQGIPLR
jgi:FAD/FMN-containing dehydrogenase